MKVKTSSWHYRLWKLGRLESSQPRDLCRYFWHLALIKILIPTTLISGFLLGVGVLVWLIWSNPLASALITSGVLFGVAALIGLYLLIKKMNERHEAKKRRRESNPEPPKEPSVLRQYLAARKRKVCPLIEVVDNSDHA